MTSSRDGRPRSCPMQIVVDGRVWRYVGGLKDGAPVYELARLERSDEYPGR